MTYVALVLAGMAVLGYWRWIRAERRLTPLQTDWAKAEVRATRLSGELHDARLALEAEQDRHHVTSMQLELADRRCAELEIALERKNIAGRYFGRNADKGRQMIVDRLDNPPPGP